MGWWGVHNSWWKGTLVCIWIHSFFLSVFVFNISFYLDYDVSKDGMQTTRLVLSGLIIYPPVQFLDLDMLYINLDLDMCYIILPNGLWWDYENTCLYMFWSKLWYWFCYMFLDSCWVWEFSNTCADTSSYTCAVCEIWPYLGLTTWGISAGSDTCWFSFEWIQFSVVSYIFDEPYCQSLSPFKSLIQFNFQFLFGFYSSICFSLQFNFQILSSADIFSCLHMCCWQVLSWKHGNWAVVTMICFLLPNNFQEGYNAVV